jgi:signal transduction histidine kinase
MGGLKSLRSLIGFRLAAGLAVLGLTSAAGSFFFGPLSAGVYQPTPGFSWFVPAAQGFATLASLSIALVCFGRYRAIGGAWLFWFGQLQLSAAVLGVFYVLAWLGGFNLGLGIGSSPSTFWWFGGLIAITRMLGVAALGARRPRSLSAPAYRAASVATLAVCLLAGVWSLRHESSLPGMIDGRAFTDVSLWWRSAASAFLLAGAAFAAFRSWKEKDRILESVSVYFAFLAVGILHLVGAGKNGGWWYLGYVELVSASGFVLMGFLREGYELLSQERTLLLERARLLGELERVNEEMRSFNYTVAHDLRSPVLAIARHAESVFEKEPSALAPETRESLERVAALARSSERIVGDLLRLSQASDFDLESRDVDLSGLARSIASELEREEPERAVELRIAPGLSASADPGMARVALENLLRNAWKFTSRTLGARVEFGAQGHGAERAFFIRDNGIGFEPAEAAGLFEPFRRMESAASFPGSGIGLATARRIVQRHGGRMWAEAAPGRGATFFFTLRNANC